MRESSPVPDGIFGLRVVGALPHLAERAAPGAPVVHVETTTDIEVEDRWAAGARAPAVRFSRGMPGAPPGISVTQDPALGFRIWARGLGTHLVARDGTSVATGVPEAPIGASRARLVTSQVLPLLALLHGREVLHAGGLLVGERLVALTAPSGTGKTSTVARSVASGARFFADDAIGLSLVDAGTVVAHPGPRLFAVPLEELEAMAADGRARLGRLLATPGKVLLEPPEAPPPRRLDVVVLLERGREPVGWIGPVAERGRALLGAASLPWMRSRARLVRQLELTAALDRSVTVLRLVTGTREDAGVVARRLLDYL